MDTSAFDHLNTTPRRRPSVTDAFAGTVPDLSIPQGIAIGAIDEAMVDQALRAALRSDDPDTRLLAAVLVNIEQQQDLQSKVLFAVADKLGVDFGQLEFAGEPAASLDDDVDEDDDDPVADPRDALIDRLLTLLADRLTDPGVAAPAAPAAPSPTPVPDVLAEHPLPPFPRGPIEYSETPAPTRVQIAEPGEMPRVQPPPDL